MVSGDTGSIPVEVAFRRSHRSANPTIHRRLHEWHGNAKRATEVARANVTALVARNVQNPKIG
ncbi:MAG: hypothetical protein QG549_126 [Patescibacteria group bacterium]|nr:hypothetical protein [Patescibacteria group bacterium]